MTMECVPKHTIAKGVFIVRRLIADLSSYLSEGIVAYKVL
jgi:hypothetical protein